MSFEKKMKKRGNQKLDAFAKNPYHQEPIVEVKPARRGMPLWSKILIPLGSVAVAVFGTFIGMRMVFSGVNMSANKGGNAVDHDEAQTPDAYQGDSRTGVSYQPEENSNAYYVPIWSECTIVEKYPQFTYLDNQYHARYNDIKPIDSQYINTKIKDLTVKGHDIYENVDHYIDAELYSIKNIALDASIAIKFNDDEDYYAYQNIACYFADIEQLLDKLSFINEVTFPEIYHNDYDIDNNYNRTIYHHASTERIVEILFDDVTIKNSVTKPRLHLLNNETSEPSDTSIGSQNTPQRSITLITAIKALGIDNAGMQLYENGILHVNLFGSLATFNLPEIKYQSLVSYITSLN